MKRRLTISLFFVLLLPLTASITLAQISITYTDLQSILVNSTRVNHGYTYHFGAEIDLGTPAAGMQSFDFGAPPAPDASESMSQTFVDPSGQPGASSFPTANLCVPIVDSTTLPGAMLTFVEFFRLQADGLYLLGQYSHQYWPPLVDDEYVQAYSPMRLFLPLPLTYGASRTGRDTVFTDTTNNDYNVTTTTLTVDGWGDITLPTVPGAFPKTAAVSCLRGTQTEVVEVYSAGTFAFREKYVSVVFVTGEGAVLSAEQGDSSFSGGTATVISLDYSYRSGGATDVRRTSPSLPDGYSLSQNYPNPFNPSTTIAFSVPVAGRVNLSVFDLLGREVATLVNRQMSPGSYEATFDAAGLPSGLYLCRIVSGSFVETRKMNLMK